MNEIPSVPLKITFFREVIGMKKMFIRLQYLTGNFFEWDYRNSNAILLLCPPVRCPISTRRHSVNAIFDETVQKKNAWRDLSWYYYSMKWTGAECVTSARTFIFWN